MPHAVRNVWLNTISYYVLKKNWAVVQPMLAKMLSRKTSQSFFIPREIVLLLSTLSLPFRTVFFPFISLVWCSSVYLFIFSIFQHLKKNKGRSRQECTSRCLVVQRTHTPIHSFLLSLFLLLSLMVILLLFHIFVVWLYFSFIGFILNVSNPSHSPCFTGKTWRIL